MAFPAAVLWDMDGTLVDTEPYWIRAQHEIVEAFGGQWTDELALQLVGKDLMVSAALMRANSHITWSEERIVEELLVRVVAAVREHLPWRPGARELLEELAAAGTPRALVTMSWRSLADAVLAALPEDRQALLLASVDRFVAEDPEVPGARQDRANLVRRLGLFGVGLAVRLIASGEAPDADTLARRLVAASGVDDLRRVLMTQFASRRELLKARAALVVLQSVLRDDPIDATPDLAFDLERVQAGAHEFTELRLFNAFRSGAVTFRPDEEEEVDRLLGSNGTAPVSSS